MRNDSSNNEEEGIGILSLFKLLISKWYWLFGLSLTGLITALGICASIPNQYESSVLLQVGSKGTPGTDIEPPQHLIERINSVGFASMWQNPNEKWFSIRAFSPKNTKLIRITVVSHSPETGSRILGHVIEKITAEHKLLSSDAERYLMFELNQINRQLEEITLLRRESGIVTSKTASERSDSFNNLAIFQSQQQLHALQLALEDKARKANSELLERRTFKTMAVEGIQTGIEPTYPKTTSAALSGIMGGLLIGALIVFSKFNLN